MLLIALAPVTMTLAPAREVDNVPRVIDNVQLPGQHVQAYTSRWPRHHFTQQAWVHFIKSGTKSRTGPADIFFFSMTSCVRVPRCNFSQQVLAHFLQSGRRPAQICELFAEQGIGYALWSSGQVHHRVVLFGGDVACSRDQTPRNLHPLVHLP